MSAAFEDSFKGKSVLVTGAGRGIGRVLCKRLDEIGAKVYAVSRTQSTLDSLVQENPRIHAICTDLANWEQGKHLLEKLEPMDYLVNNAAVMIFGTFLDMTPDSIDRAMDTNIKSVVNISQLIAKKMIERGRGGAIVNVSSLASKITGQGCVPYSLTKAALDMLTKSMAYELGPHNIRVNSINPGVVLTDMGKELVSQQANASEAVKLYLGRCPIKRSITELDVVNAILVLLSDYSSMTTGETILVDGGYMTN